MEVADVGMSGLKSPKGSASAIAPLSLMMDSRVVWMEEWRCLQESKGSVAFIMVSPYGSMGLPFTKEPTCGRHAGLGRKNHQAMAWMNSGLGMCDIGVVREDSHACETLSR